MTTPPPPPPTPPPVVLDTSVAVKWFFDEPHSAEAARLLDGFERANLRALAPDLIYPEFASAIWKRVRRNGLSPEDDAGIVGTFLALPLEIVPSFPLLLAAYRLALEYARTVYDALFLALSLEVGADLVTADDHLYKAMHPRLPRVKWIGDWAGQGR